MAMDKVDEALFLINEKSGFEYVNATACRSLGYSSGELLELCIADIDPEYPLDLWPEHWRQLKAGDSLRFETTHQRKDRSRFPVEITANYIEHGTHAYNIAMARDITERKQKEEALGESHRLLRAVTEGTSDAVYVKDTNHRYLLVNSVVSRALNLRAEEMIGRSDWELLPIELAPGIVETDRRIMESGELEVLEEKVAGRVWSVKKWPLRGADAKVEGIIGISRDITEYKRRQELSDALNRIDASIASTLDLGEVPQRAIKESAQSIGCDWSALIVREKTSWTMKYTFGLGVDSPDAKLDPEKTTYLSVVANTGKSLFIEDCLVSSQVDQELMRKLRIRSLLAVPLIVKDDVVGILALHYSSRTGGFGAAEIDFAVKAASSVSLAMENARLYTEQRHIAEKLQEAMLTMPDEIAGLDFGHAYCSATVEPGRAGGDFYDLFDIERDKVGIVIGDVSGKGLEAATLTVLVKNTVKAFAYAHNSPAKSLSLTNKVLVKESPPNVFVTLFFGVLDKESGEFGYCNGGHPPPILGYPGAGAKFLSSGGPIVGIFEDLDYQDARETIEIGEDLVLYTDGAFEVRRASKMYGLDKLLDFVEHLRAPVPDIPKLILNEIQEYGEGTLWDDVAVLAVSRKKQPAKAARSSAR